MFGGGLIASAMCSNITSGGDEPQNLKWERPAEWPQMPEPDENEYCILYALRNYEDETKRNTAYCSTYTYGLDADYKYVLFPSSATQTVDWGDGNISEGNVNSAYHEYSLPSESGFAIVKVHINDVPSNIKYLSAEIQNVTDIGTIIPLELYLGKNCVPYSGTDSMQHVKYFGWSPDKQTITSSYMKICPGTNIKCVESVTPWKTIPDNAFQYVNCLYDFDLSECEYIGKYAFISNYAIKKVNAPKCTFVGENAFSSCKALTSLYLPQCIEFGNYAFSYCYDLSEIVCAENAIIPQNNINSGMFITLRKKI